MKVKLLPVTAEQVAQIDLAAQELTWLLKVTQRKDLEPLIATLVGVSRSVMYAQEYEVPTPEPVEA